MLDTAERFLRRLLDVLRPWIRQGVPVVGVEPSCVAVFRDELVGLLPHDEDAKRLSLQTLTLAEYLRLHAAESWSPPQLHRRAVLHLHCHQSAVMGGAAEMEVLRAMGLDVQQLDAGCCGLAGSFGFEREHHELSVRIAEQRLLPAIRDAGEQTLLIADGFSCKTQIEQLSDRRALHLAQVVKMAMEHGPAGPPGARPERLYPDLAR
jgi:Fe-S oxidoreductase